MFYDGVCAAHGLSDISSKERLAAIEKIPSLDLFLKVPPSIPSLPMLDGDLVTAAPTFASAEEWSGTGKAEFPGLEWCKEVFIGDSQMDVRILSVSCRTCASN